jgi:hypothetical protein
MNQKRKRPEKTFKPKELFVQDLMNLKEDDFLKFVDQQKNEQWDALPITKQDLRRKEDAERIENLAGSHLHHPTNFKVKEWLVKNSKKIEEMEYVGFTDELILAFMNTEFHRAYDTLSIQNHPILKCDDLSQFMRYFKNELGVSFNFICTQTEEKGQCLLVSNVCDFDFTYFCVYLSFPKTNIETFMHDHMFKNGIILLRYDLNSKTVESAGGEKKEEQQNTKTKSDNNNDNVQESEYQTLIESFKDLKIKIKRSFFMACPCVNSSSVDMNDLICIIEGGNVGES